MQMEEVLAKLKDIVTDRLNVEEEQIKPEASCVEDLGADSLDIVELIMDLEQEFNIEIPDEELPKVQTVADIVGYLDPK